MSRRLSSRSGRAAGALACLFVAAACGGIVVPPPASLDVGAARLPVDAAHVERHLDALAEIASEHGGTRAAGTPGYDASAAYVVAELEALGYAVERQAVDFTFFEEQAPVSLSVGGRSWSGSEWLHAMLYSAAGDVAGELETVGIASGAPTATAGCSPTDWQGFTSGRIAVVMSGPCIRREQVLLAQEAGAVALIGPYPAWGAGQTRRPTLIDPSGIEIPVVAAGGEPSGLLFAGAAAREVAHVVVDARGQPVTADNVIAERAGSSGEVVMIGAHLDSVLDGPGINDNGSGVAALLAIARAAAAERAPEKTVRFAFWAAEEFGTIGSAQYVDRMPAADRNVISAYFNADMLGSRNGGLLVYDEQGAPAGSGEITQLLLDSLARPGTPGTPVDLHSSSDHGPFTRAGIPTGGLFSGASTPLSADEAISFGGRVGAEMDACYHLACDDRTNIRVASLMALARALADGVSSMAY